ncbi:hypothetical protein AMECASPLE_038072 [Ameca splendens]|uniref:Uncharacterized protein n=1 Tax=Ameca splendens TaxID=208324 RepID=A0ABV0YVR0_9TELE
MMSQQFSVRQGKSKAFFTDKSSDIKSTSEKQAEIIYEKAEAGLRRQGLGKSSEVREQKQGRPEIRNFARNRQGRRICGTNVRSEHGDQL